MTTDPPVPGREGQRRLERLFPFELPTSLLALGTGHHRRAAHPLLDAGRGVKRRTGRPAQPRRHRRPAAHLDAPAARC